MLRTLPSFLAVSACVLAALPICAAERASNARLVLRMPIAETSPGLRARAAAVTAVAISPDGALVAAGGDTHGLHIWNARTGESEAKIPAHRDWVRAASFSADGASLATVGNDHTLRVWESTGGSTPLHVHKCDGPLQAVAFHPLANQLATVGFGEHMRLFDLEVGQEVTRRGCACEDIRSVAISPDGRWAAAAGRNGMVRIWDLAASGGHVDLPSDGRRIRALAFSPSSGMLAAAGDGPAVRLWRSDDWQANTDPTPQELLIRPGKAYALAFLSDEQLAIGGTQNRITVWNTDAASPIADLVGHTGTVATLAISADRQTLVSGSYDTTVRVWDTRDIGERTSVARGPTLVR